MLCVMSMHNVCYSHVFNYTHVVYMDMLVNAQVCRAGIVHSIQLEDLQAPILSRPCTLYRTAAAMQYLTHPDWP